MAIPTSEVEAVAELKKICDMTDTFKRGLQEVADDRRYPQKDRETAGAIVLFCGAQLDLLNEVMQGLSAMSIIRSPADIGALVRTLTR